jgi:purine-binding chemotaxis protein CheW
MCNAEEPVRGAASVFQAPADLSNDACDPRASGDVIAPQPAPGSHPKDLSMSESMRTELITFAIGSEQYGVDIMSVREIKGWTDITHLPKQPDYVRGVLNLRGVMVPIIDLRCRLGEGLTEATALHVVIIVQVADQQIGLLADRVLDIVGFEVSQVQPVPKVARNNGIDLLSGLVTSEAGMIALIDLRRLLAVQGIGEPEPQMSAA